MDAARTRRILARSFLALLVVVVTGIGIERSVTRGNDFDNFHDAAVSVWETGAPLPGKGTERYLPSFEVLMSPLGALPIEAAAPLWVLLNLACYALLVRIFDRAFGIAPRDQVPGWFCVAPFVVSNLTLGQNAPLLLALSVAGVAASTRARDALGGAASSTGARGPVGGVASSARAYDALAGAAITLAALLKVLPAALLAIPLALGRAVPTAAGAAATGAAVALWMALALGPGPAFDDSWRWVIEVRGEQTPQRLVETARSLRYNNQGLAVTLARTFGDFAPRPWAAAPGSTQLTALPLAWVWAAYAALMASFAVAFAALLWRVRARGPTPRDVLGVLGAATPLMLAASPLVWTHYFLWLLPGFVYLAGAGGPGRRRALWAVGALSLAANFWIPARGLGFHMALGLALAARVGADVWHRPQNPPH